MMSIELISKRFPGFEKELLEEMAKEADIKQVHEGDVMVRTGQHLRSGILVAEGVLKVYREDDAGGEYFIYYLEAGGACAISLVCTTGAEPASLMAKAVTDATIILIPASCIEKWMGKYKSWSQFAIDCYKDRFEELLKTIDHVAFKSMDERLLYYLRQYQIKLQTNTVKQSFTEIANDLHSSREVISRLMKKLAEKGAIRLQRKQVEIVNLEMVI